MTEHEWLGNAEVITVVSDENGWELWISTDQGTYGVNVHGVSEQLPEQSKQIADYWTEGRAAAAEHAATLDGAEGFGYAINDPKHPDYHDNMSGVWDNREKS